MYQSFVVLAPPLILNQEVAFEDGLDDEVVFFIALLKQILLHDRQLGFVNADEAALRLCHGHLLPYL